MKKSRPRARCHLFSGNHKFFLTKGSRLQLRDLTSIPSIWLRHGDRLLFMQPSGCMNDEVSVVPDALTEKI